MADQIGGYSRHRQIFNPSTDVTITTAKTKELLTF